MSSTSTSWNSLCKGRGSDDAGPEWVVDRRPSLVQESSGWKIFVSCPTEVLPLLLPLVGGRKVPAVAQKPSRLCLLLSAEPRRSEGGFGQTEVCSRTKLCGEPKAIPLVDATIRERNAIEEVECCNEAYLCCGVQKVWRKWRPPPWRKAVGVLVQDDGERGTGLKSGRCGARTL